MPKPGINNSKVFYLRKSYVSSRRRNYFTCCNIFRRQRVDSKVYLRRIVTETLDQIQNAYSAQENPKFKVMASRDAIIDELNLIKSFDVKIVNSLTSEEDSKRNY